MDELYEYLKDKVENGGDSINIDLSHAFRLYQLICFMKQIRGIVNNEDDMWNNFRRIKEGR